MKIRNIIAASLLTIAGLTGAAQTGPHVHNTWSAGTGTPTTTGFRIYRATAVNGSCGTFSTTTWTNLVPAGINLNTPVYDDFVTQGSTSVTYCYATTAYDTTNGGGESGPSNITTVVIPASQPTGTPAPQKLTSTFSSN